jgi:copper homeostasis protein
MSKQQTRKVEVCAYSLESCLAAEEAGADRIELCASPFEGGTTPPAGMAYLAVHAVSLPVNVMVRPRGDDFCYDETEFAVMKAEIEAFKAIGVAGIVLGILTPEGEIDVARTRELTELAAPLPVTFHRAIDFAVDMEKAVEDVIAAGCRIILTSGGKDKAPDGAETIARMVAAAAGRIDIMAGSGVSGANATRLLQTGADALHLTGKVDRDSAMAFRKPGIALGGVPSIPEYAISYTDPARVKAVVDAVRQWPA